MASDVDSKQNEATCSNKTKPKYKPVSGRLREHFGLTYFQRYMAHNTLQKLTKINYSLIVNYYSKVKY